jgi:hypothetical protein
MFPKLFVVLAVLAVLPQVCLALDEEREPALKYSLEINGQRHEILLDTPTELKGAFENPKVTLTASPTREFSFGAVKFEYPANFTWEANLKTPDLKFWIMSGNDFKIMYFIHDEGYTLETHVESMIEQFGKTNTVVTESQRKLGGRIYKGRNLRLTIANTKINQEVYVFAAKGMTRLIILQDSAEEANGSDEGRKTMELLSRTFVDTSTAKAAEKK